MSDDCNAVLLDVAAAVNSTQTGGKLKLGCMWHLKVKAGGLLVVLLEQKDNEMMPLCFCGNGWRSAKAPGSSTNLNQLL